MDNELDLNLDNIEAQAEEKLKVKNRFEKLSENVILEKKAKTEAEAKAKAEADRADALSKERDFYKDFSANTGKYPNASQYQDKIWGKVKLGYSTEDAMVAVLNAEGKLGTTSQPIAQQQSYSGQVAGGSSSTNVPDNNKSIENMTSKEKLAELIEAEKRGEISLT